MRGKWQVDIIHRSIDESKYPLGNTNIGEYKKQSSSFVDNPVKIRLTGQTLAPGQRGDQTGQAAGRQLADNVFGGQGGLDAVRRPPEGSGGHDAGMAS